MSRRLVAWGHCVGFVGVVAGCASGDVHAVLCGFDDDREDCGPEAGLRVIVLVSTDRAGVSVVVLEGGFDRVEEIGVRFVVVVEQCIDALFSGMRTDQFRKPVVDVEQFGVDRVIGVSKVLSGFGLDQVYMFDRDFEVGRSLWRGENDIGRDGPLGSFDGVNGISEAILFVEVSECEVVGDAMLPGGSGQRIEAGSEASVVESDVGDESGLCERGE